MNAHGLHYGTHVLLDEANLILNKDNKIGFVKARGTEDAVLTATNTGAREIKLGKKDDAVRRFISLVDEFYERRVNLYLVSDTPLQSLYTEGSLTFEFQRTQSRLTEMASEEYQQLAHRP